jgi:hypothetical protein
MVPLAAAQSSSFSRLNNGRSAWADGVPPSLAKPADLTVDATRTKRIAQSRNKATCPDRERTNRAAHIKNVLATCSTCSLPPPNIDGSLDFFQIVLAAKPARVAAQLLEVMIAA